MALQNISPINDQLADTIVRASEPWIETSPGMAWTKVLNWFLTSGDLAMRR